MKYNFLFKRAFFVIKDFNNDKSLRGNCANRINYNYMQKYISELRTDDIINSDNKLTKRGFFIQKLFNDMFFKMND